MRVRITLLAALLALAPAYAAADDTPQPAQKSEPAAAAPAPAAAPSAADPDEKVCKVERELGSNKLKRVCRTRAQIDADSAAAREALGREQRR